MLGEDWGERYESARTAAEFLNAGFQPMTKGWFSGSEELKTSTTTKWEWGMLDPEAYWIPEDVATQDYSFDREDMHFRSQMRLGEIQKTPDGRSYVVTNKGNHEIPTHVTGRDGQSYSIQDKANAIRFAQAGVDPEGPGSIIGDRGSLGPSGTTMGQTWWKVSTGTSNTPVERSGRSFQTSLATLT